MKYIYDIKFIILMSYMVAYTSLWATYDPTLSGYGTAVAYQGKHLDSFLDAGANTNEGLAASPYGIVTTGSCALNTTLLPDYPSLSQLPCVSRFNRDGTKDTNFGSFFPGTGWYINDPSTSALYPSLFPGSLRVGKLVFMNIAGSSPVYFWLYRNGAPQTNFFLYKYFPLTGRLDGNFPQSLSIHKEDGTAITATVTCACTVQIADSVNTTSVMYVSYYDAGGNSYIAALTYSPTTDSFSYDTSFATNGVVKFASGTGGATTVHFNSINYDSSADALIVAGSCISSGAKVIVARYDNLTTGAGLDTSFNTTGYAILAAPGGTTPAIISQYIFAKIVNTGTFYYYCAGWDSSGPQLDICYLDPSTATFVDPGSGSLINVGVTGIQDSYQIYDMVQIPDYSDSLAVAVAVGAGRNNPLYAGIINFQFEDASLDWESNPVGIIDVDASLIGQAGADLAFYSCLYDPTLYAAAPINLPGVFVGGNISGTGCFINYTYGLEPGGSTTTYGMIPNQGIGSGVGFLDYEDSTYPGGFLCQQVFYSDASSNPSYYVCCQGIKSLSDSDFGIIRFDLETNSFDYTFSGSSGNPFCLVAPDTVPAVSVLDGTTGIVYTVSVATASTGFTPGDLVLTAFDLTSGSFGLVTAFTRNGQTDNGIIPYSISAFSGLGGTTFVDLDLALQNISGSQTKLIVAGTNDLLEPGFVARFNTIPSGVGDGILDLTFATPDGYNIFNPLGNTYLSSCAVDAANNVVVAGAVGSGDPISAGQLVVARYTPDGILDTNFGPAPQVGYGYFNLLGFSGTGYEISVNNIEFDPGTNMYFVGQYTAPLATGSTTSGTSPFIARLISLGVQDSTFYNNYGTFIIPLQYVQGTGNFNICLYDIEPISNLSSGTMYAIGFIEEIIDTDISPFATLIRFSIQGLNLSKSQSLNSGVTSTVPTNIQGNICPDLVVPPIYVVQQITSAQGSSVYFFNTMKTVADVENRLNLDGIISDLNISLLAAGATSTVADTICANFQTIMQTLIENFVTTFAGNLLTNILYLSQSIATNECLLVTNGSLIVANPNQLQAIYAAETKLQSNIKTAASYCTNTLVSPYQ